MTLAQRFIDALGTKGEQGQDEASQACMPEGEFLLLALFLTVVALYSGSLQSVFLPSGKIFIVLLSLLAYRAGWLLEATKSCTPQGDGFRLWFFGNPKADC